MVDPISTTLIVKAVTEVAKAASGEAGKQAWTSLTGLVRRVFGHDSQASEALEAVRAAPAEQVPAAVLAGMVAERARTDAAFGAELRAWLAEADRVSGLRTGDGDVTNVVSPGARVGSLVQGRDFHGSITLGTPPAP